MAVGSLLFLKEQLKGIIIMHARGDGRCPHTTHRWPAGCSREEYSLKAQCVRIWGAKRRPEGGGMVEAALYIISRVRSATCSNGLTCV